MAEYNISALNDKEFEVLSADLLSEHFGVRIERFKPGKDKGVDGRWFRSDGSEVVVQCKHWIKSGVERLIGHLRKAEVTKIARLNPSRYILTTTVPLSRQNKQSIQEALAPYIASETDIFGNEDINDLLERHPQVAKRHYKLWLASADAIGFVINNAILGRSRYSAQRMQEKLSIYVPTQDHQKAAEALAKRRIVIITGAPGIGKTTLADQLVLEYIAQGYELISVEEDLSEAESAYKEENKQVFYFDDFLGRNLLEALDKKFDSHIVGFISRVARDPYKRFVLTSRTNILNQGKGLSEIFSIEKIERNEYELRIGSLDRVERAKILYNHIWNSRLSEEMVDELYLDRRYHKIIDHRNFNPRLISFVTDPERVYDISPGSYWDYVQRTLANPESIWEHVFTKQLDQDCRDITYAVAFNARPMGEDVLRALFCGLPQRAIAHPGNASRDFRIATKVAAGSVLNRNVDAKTGNVTYGLYNPSIADYVYNSTGIEEQSFYIGMLRTLSALNNAFQMHRAKIITREHLLGILDLLASGSQGRVDAPDDFHVLLVSKLIHVPRLKSRYGALIEQCADNVDIANYSGEPSALLTIIDWVLRFQNKERATALLASFVETARHWKLSIDDLGSIAEIVNGLGEESSIPLPEKVYELAISRWEDMIDNYVAEKDLLGSFNDPEEEGLARGVVEEHVRDEFSRMGIHIDADDLDRICCQVDVGEILEQNLKASLREDDAYDAWRDDRLEREQDDALIDDMFERDN